MILASYIIWLGQIVFFSNFQDIGVNEMYSVVPVDWRYQFLAIGIILFGSIIISCLLYSERKRGVSKMDKKEEEKEGQSFRD